MICARFACLVVVCSRSPSLGWSGCRETRETCTLWNKNGMLDPVKEAGLNEWRSGLHSCFNEMSPFDKVLPLRDESGIRHEKLNSLWYEATVPLNRKSGRVIYDVVCGQAFSRRTQRCVQVSQRLGNVFAAARHADN